MASKSDKQQQQRWAYHRPLYERIQEKIFALDIGVGAQFFRIGSFGLLLALVILVYTGTQFYGLRDPQAMDLSQLARNIGLGRGYVTRVIRPLDLYHLEATGKLALSPQRPVEVPELWSPPMYPLVMAMPMALVGVEAGGVSAHRAERMVMLMGWFFFVAAMAVMYLLARELFDERVAVLSVFLFLFCQSLLEHAVSGLPTCWTAVLVLLTAYGLLKAERWQRAQRSAWWINGALIVSALAVAVGALTQYAVVMLAPVLLVYVFVAFPRDRWRKIVLCAAVFVVVMVPWMARNRWVSQKWFGLASRGLVEQIGEGRFRTPEGQMQRLYGYVSPWRLRVLMRKALDNARVLYERVMKETGANYVIVFFLVSLLHRWRDDEAVRLRWLCFWGMIGCAVWLCVAGVPRRNFFAAFVPLILVYGAAFFLVLFERLQFRTRFLRRGMVALFVLANMTPVVLAVLPPRKTLPYPPYSLITAAELGRTFRSDELLASDIPWAVAWYADRSALWMPWRERDFIEINDRVRMVSCVYLTQATLQDVSAFEMLLHKEEFVLRLYQPPVPERFPLKHYRTLPPDGEQVLLSNRGG
jgi:4-amino-4-deoxy-L-arabinose transferase-like glycosyltransferase